MPQTGDTTETELPLNNLPLPPTTDNTATRAIQHTGTQRTPTVAGIPLTQTGTTDSMRPLITLPTLGGGFPPLSTTMSTSEFQPSLVSIGQSLPLLPRKLIQQIKAGEYVDFSELPPAKGRQLAPPNYMSQLVLVQLHEVERQRKLIPDFLTWSQCFAIYTAVLGRDQPHRIPELMAYQLEIAKCAKKYKWPSWVIYDLNFRQEAASKPGMSWATVEPSIYTQCFNSMVKDPSDVWCRTCQALDHATAFCPLMPQQKVPRREKREPNAVDARKDTICRNYITKGCSYPHCIRRHVCMKCGEKHPVTRCKETATQLVQRPTQSGTSSI